MLNISKQIATNSEESNRQDNAMKCSLRLTQDFFVDELSTCECVDRGFISGHFMKFLGRDSSVENAKCLARQEGLQNRLAISLERNTCGA